MLAKSLKNRISTIRHAPVRSRLVSTSENSGFKPNIPTVKTSVKWIEGMDFIGVSSSGKGVIMSGGDGPGVAFVTLYYLISIP